MPSPLINRWEIWQVQTSYILCGEIPTTWAPPINGILNNASINFDEQAKHIRGTRTNSTFSLRPLNSLLAILKNTLELEEWTNKNQEFSQWNNRKRRGLRRNLVDVSPINVLSAIFFHLNRVGKWRHLTLGAFRVIFVKIFEFYLVTPSL